MMDGYDYIGEGLLLQRQGDGRKQNTAVAHRKPHRRRDLLSKNMRALANPDEALMASLGIGFSSALEEQGAPVASNGGGGVDSQRWLSSGRRRDVGCPRRGPSVRRGSSSGARGSAAEARLRGQMGLWGVRG